MFDAQQSRREEPQTAVIGAGFGGLSCAIRLRAAGHNVTLFDAHNWVGGKARAVPSTAGPIDAGPTVLTMRHVFDELFAAAGVGLDDFVTLIEEPTLARHFWPDGTVLDLTSDQTANERAISETFGRQSAVDYTGFSNEAAALFEMFDAPMMQAADPNLVALAKTSLSNPAHLGTLSPLAKLERHLRKRFSEPRLAQLFARYATYVGGHPAASPALLSLIWHAESAGVWRVNGGMHSLANALGHVFTQAGGTIRLGTPIEEIVTNSGKVTGVRLKGGEFHGASQVVYAGDPRALATGLLGKAVREVAPQSRTAKRSLSARVWSFAAKLTKDPGLAHHNVFFGKIPGSEFTDIARGKMPSDPTIYLCAEDRGTGMSSPEGPERFEIILNSAPLTEAHPIEGEVTQCRQTTFQTLERFGVSFQAMPPDKALATPKTFENLFPGSAGSLYGQTPHGMTAALQRPRARTAITGLYLAGGGTHPGAGVPMATLSGKHAAEAILKDRALT